MAFAVLLATVVSFGGTTVYAAGTQEKVYIVSFPRSGDVSSNTGWGHTAQSYLNGWSTNANNYTVTRAIGSYEGQACYCIEPGVSQQTGDTLTQKDENFCDTKNFFDCILPSTLKFMADHYIVGDNYCCVWAIREYPTNTSEQALLSQLADRTGVTLRIYHRLVDSIEQQKIVQHSARKNKLMSGGDDVNDAIEAESNLQEVMDMLVNIRKNHEVLLHVAVFIELKARNLDALRELQNDISMELTRAKITVDRLTLRQKEGFLWVIPIGSNQFGAQFERVLPVSSAANLYPFNFRAKPIRTECTSGATSTAAACWWISTAALRTRPTAMY